MLYIQEKKGSLRFFDRYNLVERKHRTWYFKTFIEPRNRFQGIDSAGLCSLAGRYDNPIGRTGPPCGIYT
jgi:hypothetical protein